MIGKTKEFYGHFHPMTHEFSELHSESYKKLILSLQNTDKRYSKTTTIEQRIELTADSIKNWSEYIEDKKTKLSEVNSQIYIGINNS